MAKPLDKFSGLTSDELKKWLSYSPETGLFTWIAVGPKTRTAKVGDIAGSLQNDGYINIGVCTKRFRAHRLAWLYVYGQFPDGILDHKNRDRSDNRISNLRECSYAENQANKLAQKNNKLGVKGVSKFEDKFAAFIKIGGKNKNLGLFKTIDDAGKAYLYAAQSAFGKFAINEVSACR